jgi:hypothetical protein
MLLNNIHVNFIHLSRTDPLRTPHQLFCLVLPSQNSVYHVNLHKQIVVEYHFVRYILY